YRGNARALRPVASATKRGALLESPRRARDDRSRVRGRPPPPPAASSWRRTDTRADHVDQCEGTSEPTRTCDPHRRLARALLSSSSSDGIQLCPSPLMGCVQVCRSSEKESQADNHYHRPFDGTPVLPPPRHGECLCLPDRQARGAESRRREAPPARADEQGGVWAVDAHPESARVSEVIRQATGTGASLGGLEAPIDPLPGSVLRGPCSFAHYSPAPTSARIVRDGRPNDSLRAVAAATGGGGADSAGPRAQVARKISSHNPGGDCRRLGLPRRTNAGPSPSSPLSSFARRRRASASAVGASRLPHASLEDDHEHEIDHEIRPSVHRAAAPEGALPKQPAHGVTRGCLLHCTVTRTSYEAAWAQRGTGHRTAPLRGPQGPSSADHCVVTMPKTRARLGRTDPKPQGNLHDQYWNDRYRELVAYKAEHGDCNVSQSQKPLGKWVDNQRQLQRRGELREGRVKELEKLGFVWVVCRGRPKLGGDAGAAGRGATFVTDVEANTYNRKPSSSPMPPLGDVVLYNSDGLTESSPAGDRGEEGECNAAGKNAPDNRASASMMPPLSNLAELVSESEPSNTSGPDQEDLVQPDETCAAGNEADRGSQTCRDGDGGSSNTNEHTAGGNGALLARIEELEAANHAKDENMKASKAANHAKDEKIKALEAVVAGLRREGNLRNDAAKVQLKEKHEALKDAKEAYGQLLPALRKLNSADAEIARLREGKNRSEGRLKVKQEKIVYVKNELEDRKETAEELTQKLETTEVMCLQLQELAQNASQENEEVRREARRKLANTSTEPCMWPNCRGNRGSQRNILMGCGHVVCYECIKDDVQMPGYRLGASEPFMLVLRGACACKIASTNLEASLEILTGISSLLLELENCGFVQLTNLRMEAWVDTA
ncbi:hypothetical protein THAOC_34853, partial [Thalassiosira oceanica]